ncbi:MAG: HAD-IIIA family hydrolase [Defluviitaleaceae bacterium]|nr:HAD-IIIA family hydrolase [Defluviitaleaceae bacterium]
MIDHIVLDVDGTLTDGKIIISNHGEEIKNFHVRDGQIIIALPKLGYHLLIITGRTSKITEIRANELKINTVLQGVQNKEKTLNDYFKMNYITGDRFAYIGDDLNDYSAMKLCAFKACPADAVTEIRGLCDYVSVRKGGQGAVREICEYLLQKQNQYESFLQLFRAC